MRWILTKKHRTKKYTFICGFGAVNYFYNISAEFFIYLILCVIYYLRILIQVSDIFAFHKKKSVQRHNSTTPIFHFIFYFYSGVVLCVYLHLSFKAKRCKQPLGYASVVSPSLGFTQVQSPSVSLTCMFMDEGKGRDRRGHGLLVRFLID